MDGQDFSMWLALVLVGKTFLATATSIYEGILKSLIGMASLTSAVTHLRECYQASRHFTHCISLEMLVSHGVRPGVRTGLEQRASGPPRCTLAGTVLLQLSASVGLRRPHYGDS